MFSSVSEFPAEFTPEELYCILRTTCYLLTTYFYHTATLAIGYHADIHSIASVDDKHDFIAKEAHNMFSNAGTNIDLEQAKYFIN